MELPTIHVLILESGLEGRINASDFDSARHIRIEDVPPAAPPAPEAPAAEEPPPTAPTKASKRKGA